MGLAIFKQHFQDWVTQQWVIVFGQKIDTQTHSWLVGPFGGTEGIGSKFISELAEKEQLGIAADAKNIGLLQSILQLNLAPHDLKRLSPEVIDFYENTSEYDLGLYVKWNPFFKGFGWLIGLLFSKRIEQLNLPMQNRTTSSALTSTLIQLYNLKSNEVKRTLWLRTFAASGQIVYSGIYETCRIPSGDSCIKAIFPLPNGNATVILKPNVGKNGALILDSSGRKMGHSGFYFLLKDAKGQLWAKFIRSFRDRLVVQSEAGRISASQTLTLWRLQVLTFVYEIEKRRMP